MKTKKLKSGVWEMRNLESPFDVSPYCYTNSVEKRSLTLPPRPLQAAPLATLQQPMSPSPQVSQTGPRGRPAGPSPQAPAAQTGMTQPSAVASLGQQSSTSTSKGFNNTPTQASAAKGHSPMTSTAKSAQYFGSQIGKFSVQLNRQLTKRAEDDMEKHMKQMQMLHDMQNQNLDRMGAFQVPAALQYGLQGAGVLGTGALGSLVGGALGTAAGSARGNMAEGLGRGLARGGATGLGAGLGGLAGSELGRYGLGAGLAGSLGGALAGGLGGYYLGGKALGEPAGAKKETDMAKSEEKKAEAMSDYTKQMGTDPSEASKNINRDWHARVKSQKLADKDIEGKTPGPGEWMKRKEEHYQRLMKK